LEQAPITEDDAQFLQVLIGLTAPQGESIAGSALLFLPPGIVEQLSYPHKLVSCVAALYHAASMKLFPTDYESRPVVNASIGRLRRDRGSIFSRIFCRTYAALALLIAARAGVNIQSGWARLI
jgi:hypothetical protein